MDSSLNTLLTAVREDRRRWIEEMQTEIDHNNKLIELWENKIVDAKASNDVIYATIDQLLPAHEEQALVDEVIIQPPARKAAAPKPAKAATGKKQTNSNGVNKMQQQANERKAKILEFLGAGVETAPLISEKLGIANKNTVGSDLRELANMKDSPIVLLNPEATGPIPKRYGLKQHQPLTEEQIAQAVEAAGVVAS